MNANRTRTLSTNTEKCSNHEFPQQQLKNYAKTVAWSYDMEGHAQQCFERHCELANKRTEQLYKVSAPCFDDHNFKKEELEKVGERSGLFQDSDFAGDLEDSKLTSGEILFIFGSRKFVPRSWMCKKQTSVSHSSTESEVISLMLVCEWTVSLLLIYGMW